MLSIGTSGIGKETIVQLAKHGPKHIYFTGRNGKAADAVVAETKTTLPNITFIPCDQSSLDSVYHAAKNFLEQSGNRLDVLICNAGVMAIPPAVSKDGYEIQFAINHLAHALLVKLCLPALQKSADGRIISVTSLAFKSAPAAGIVFKDLKSSQENIGVLPAKRKSTILKLENVLRTDLHQALHRSSFYTRRASWRMSSTPRSLRSTIRNLPLPQSTLALFIPVLVTTWTCWIG